MTNNVEIAGGRLTPDWNLAAKYRIIMKPAAVFEDSKKGLAVKDQRRYP
jgi:hypothetical protein